MIAIPFIKIAKHKFACAPTEIATDPLRKYLLELFHGPTYLMMKRKVYAHLHKLRKMDSIEQTIYANADQ